MVVRLSSLLRSNVVQLIVSVLPMYVSTHRFSEYAPSADEPITLSVNPPTQTMRETLLINVLVT